MLLRTVALLAMMCVAQAFIATQSRWLASMTKLNAIKVSVSEEEPIENVLKRFKKTVNQSGTMHMRFLLLPLLINKLYIPDNHMLSSLDNHLT